MKIKILTSCSDSQRSYSPNEEVDVSPEQGADLIAFDLAQEVQTAAVTPAGQTANLKPQGQTATVKPKAETRKP